MLHIPVCCDRGTVCPHTFMGQCSRPSECQHSTASGPKREYWSGGRRVGGRQAVYLLSSAARNLKGGADELSWTASLSICDLSSSLVPSPPLRPPSRKEAVVVKHSARFLCTSSVSSLLSHSACHHIGEIMDRVEMRQQLSAVREQPEAYQSSWRDSFMTSNAFLPRHLHRYLFKSSQNNFLSLLLLFSSFLFGAWMRCQVVT